MPYSRTANITAKVLEDYKDLIENTKSDLEDHLQQIDERLQSLSANGVVMSDEDAAERERLIEEMDSTKQCITICSQVSEHVEQVRPNAFEDVMAVQNTSQIRVTTPVNFVPAKRVTASVLNEVQEKLSSTSSNLNEHLHTIDNRLRSLGNPG